MKYKIKIDPKTIGDFEMEYLSPEEQEKKWEQIKEAIENNEQPYELELEVEDTKYIVGCNPYDKGTTSYSLVEWNTKKIN